MAASTRIQKGEKIPGKRTRNIFDPLSPDPYKLSRSKIENFLKCPRCFYLDRRLGINQPGSIPFTLNLAVDHLLKEEFDLYRKEKKPHPLMLQAGLKAIPFAHPDLDIWRENFKGVQVHHKPTQLLVTGAIDDLWIEPNGNVIVVDYKATSKDGQITLDDEWKQAYKNQMEIYQWLLRQNGLSVSTTGYFLFANARKDIGRFDGNLNFRLQLLPYVGNSDWVEPTLFKIRKCLDSDLVPGHKDGCEWCAYRVGAKGI